MKSSFGAPTVFSLERAAAPYFGIKVRAECFDTGLDHLHPELDFL